MTRLWHWIRRGLLAVVLLFVAYQLWLLGHVLWWKWMPPAETSFMSLRLDEISRDKPDAELHYRWVPYEKISIHLKRAVVAAEDDTFVDHEGFDWEGIQKAIEKNQKKGRMVAGGSTISQQLAKNLFLSGERTAARKAQEFVITFMLEALLSKRRILEIYLNHVEWGEGLFGAQAAARHYFRIDARRLGAMQAARLAVMLPAPKRFERRPGSGYLTGRAGTIAARMGAVQPPR